MKTRRNLPKMLRSSNPRLALEQRIVFDAALAATGAEVLNRNVDHADQVEQAPPATHFSAQDARVEPAKQLAKPDGDFAPDRSVTATAPAAAERVEIIFVDSAVQDIQAYLHGRNAEVVVLDAGRDGVEQIAQALAGRSNISAIHILSHGDAGEIRLGTGTLDTQNISGKYAVELATIKSALAPGADILVYGCDVAAGEQGRTFINALAQATGAAIAASTDITGASDLGGNWTLEAHTAAIEARGLQLGAWHGDLLYSNTGTGTAWTFGGTAAAATATNTTDGVTTKVTLATITGTNFVTPTPDTLNNTNGVTFFNGAQGSADFVTTFNGAATDSGTITFTFSKAVVNPVIHFDRIGGIDATGKSNSAILTLTSAGSLTKLVGTASFAVTGTTITRTPGVLTAGAESSTVDAAGTSAGSVQVNGTFTTITFSIKNNTAGSTGGDAFEIALAIDAPPVTNNDAYTTNQNTALTGNLFANNGSGVDSDIRGDALTVNTVNGASFTVGTPIALTNGSLTITNATTGAFAFTPSLNYFGTQTFTYDIRDPIGNISNTSTDTITIVHVNQSTGQNRIY